MDICIFFLILYSAMENTLGDLIVTINLDINYFGPQQQDRGKMEFREYVYHIVVTDAIKETLK